MRTNMKTKQQLIKDYQAKITQEANLEANAEAARFDSIARYHAGKKEAFKDIADALTIYTISDETTETTLVG